MATIIRTPLGKKVYGVCWHKKKLIMINSDKPLIMQYETLFHEILHYITNANLLITSIIDKMDIIK